MSDQRHYCVKCGGTGDAFDHSADEWVTPRADCPACLGTGEEAVRLIHRRVDRPVYGCSAALHRLPHSPHETCPGVLDKTAGAKAIADELLGSSDV